MNQMTDETPEGFDFAIRTIRRSDVDGSVRVADGERESEGLAIDSEHCSSRTQRRVEKYMATPAAPGERGEQWWPLEVEPTRQPDRDKDEAADEDAYIATCPICGHTEEFSASIEDLDGRSVALTPHGCIDVGGVPKGRAWPLDGRTWNAVRLV